jgi:hypothetical protein
MTHAALCYPMIYDITQIDGLKPDVTPKDQGKMFAPTCIPERFFDKQSQASQGRLASALTNTLIAAVLDRSQNAKSNSSEPVQNAASSTPNHVRENASNPSPASS